MKKIRIDLEKLNGVLEGYRKQVAERLGIHPVSLSRKLHGRYPLTLENLNEIAEYLQRDTTDFLIVFEAEQEEVDCEDLGESIKRGLLDIQAGRVRPVEELLRELSVSVSDSSGI